MLTRLHVAECTHNQEEYQKRGDSFQCSDEHGSENRDYGCLRNNKTKNQTNDQSADDPFDQADAVPFFD